MFIEVIDKHSHKVAINVKSIDYIFVCKNIYASIVLKGDTTVETGMSYEQVVKLVSEHNDNFSNS